MVNQLTQLFSSFQQYSVINHVKSLVKRFKRVNWKHGKPFTMISSSIKSKRCVFQSLTLISFNGCFTTTFGFLVFYQPSNSLSKIKFTVTNEFSIAYCQYQFFLRFRACYLFLHAGLNRYLYAWLFFILSNRLNLHKTKQTRCPDATD